MGICCLAEENKSLIAGDKKSFTVTGENKPLTVVVDSRSLIAENEKSLDHCWGLKILGDLWGCGNPS